MIYLDFFLSYEKIQCKEHVGATSAGNGDFSHHDTTKNKKENFVVFFFI